MSKKVDAPKVSSINHEMLDKMEKRMAGLSERFDTVFIKVNGKKIQC
jgi:hypothetical protein